MVEDLKKTRLANRFFLDIRGAMSLETKSGGRSFRWAYRREEHMWRRTIGIKSDTEEVEEKEATIKFEYDLAKYS